MDEIELLFGPFIQLDKGIYTLAIDYSCDNQQRYRIYAYQNEDNIYIIDDSRLLLDPYSKRLKAHFIIKEPIDNFEIRIVYNGEGDMAVKNISVTRSSYFLKEIFIVLLILFILCDGVILYHALVADMQKIENIEICFLKRTYGGLLLILFALSYFLIYAGITGDFMADTIDQIDIALANLDNSYSLNVIIIKLSHLFFRNNYRIILALIYAFFIIGTEMSFVNFASYLYAENLRNDTDKYLAHIAGICLLFLGSIYIKGGWELHYLVWDFYGRGRVASLISQPWHNVTYIEMRMCAMITLAAFFMIDRHYKYYISRKKWFQFTGALILTSMFKPNFILAFAPTVFLFYLYDLISTRGKSLKNALLLGLSILLVIPVLLTQYSLSFDENKGTGIAITFANVQSMLQSPDLVLMGIFTNLLFPLFVTAIFCFRIFTSIHNNEISEKFNKDLRLVLFSWIMFFVSETENLFLTETGYRANDGNWDWGVLFCGYFLFATMTIMLARMYKYRLIKKQTFVAGFVILGLHILSGTTYFIKLLNGAIPWVI